MRNKKEIMEEIEDEGDLKRDSSLVEVLVDIRDILDKLTSIINGIAVGLVIKKKI